MTESNKDLKPSQRAALAAEVANLSRGGDRKSDQETKTSFAITTKESTDLFKVGTIAVRDVKN